MKGFFAALAIACAIALPKTAMGTDGDDKRTRTVGGRAIAMDGQQPLAGVRVIALDGQGEYGGIVLGEAVTGEDGSFVIGGLPPERCRLWAWPQERESAGYFCELTTVEGTDDARGVIVRFWPGSSISGTLIYHGGGNWSHCVPIFAAVEPAPGCPPLHRHAPSSRQGARVERGEFRIQGIPPGKVTLGAGNICRRPFAGRIIKIERNGQRIEGPIDLSEVRHLDGFRVVVGIFESRLGGRISVRGRAAGANLTVALRPTDPDLPRSCAPDPIELTRAKRTFAFDRLVPGEYELTVSAPDARCGGGSIRPLVTKVTVPAPDGKPVEIRFDATCR